MPAHNGLSLRILETMGDAACTAREIAEHLEQPYLRIRGRMHELRRSGYVARVGEGERVAPFGRAPAKWQKVDDRALREQRAFDAAKRVVERAGFVLVPRRVL